MGFEKVSIGIKTIARDPKLFETIYGIQTNLPECQMIIADDGDMTNSKEELYAELEGQGHKIILLPYDCGFGRKSNEIVKSLDRDYLLVGSDDFDFRPPFVRKGIVDLVRVLDLTDVDIASGRVNGPYEFALEDRGDTVIEHVVRVDFNPVPWFVDCDLTVNYSLIKRRVFDKVKWDQKPNVPHSIGGCEHGMFFLDVKRAGYRVAYVPGVRIEEQKTSDSPQYRQLRRRSSDPGRACCDIRGVRKYVLGSGQIDYEAKA